MASRAVGVVGKELPMLHGRIERDVGAMAQKNLRRSHVLRQCPQITQSYCFAADEWLSVSCANRPAPVTSKVAQVIQHGWVDRRAACDELGVVAGNRA